MIEIDRQSVSRPAVLDPDDPNSPAARETAKAIAHVEDPANPKPNYKVYSNDEVKLALIELFRGKCAYCETKVNAASARDIEHFRPKGRIDPGTGEQQITPGYYWLAADWDNLLLSCPGCNRRQRQLERDDEGRWVFTDEATGKLDFFPLRHEDHRVTHHDKPIDDEEPERLLLDPCRDDPGRHLRFDDEGQILPRTIGGVVSDMAVASIAGYALNRTVLNEERKAVYLDMVRTWENVEMARQMIEQLGVPARDIVRGVITKTETDLEAFCALDRPYSATATWLFNRVFKRRLRDVRRLFTDTYGEPV